MGCIPRGASPHTWSWWGCGRGLSVCRVCCCCKRCVQLLFSYVGSTYKLFPIFMHLLKYLQRSIKPSLLLPHGLDDTVSSQLLLHCDLTKFSCCCLSSKNVNPLLNSGSLLFLTKYSEGFSVDFTLLYPIPSNVWVTASFLLIPLFFLSQNWIISAISCCFFCVGQQYLDPWIRWCYCIAN